MSGRSCCIFACRVHPVRDDSHESSPGCVLVVAPQIQVLQPHKVTLPLDPVDDGRNIGDTREDGRNEAGGLNACFMELAHSLQPPLDTHSVVHLLVEGLVQRVDGPTDTGTREGLD